jgi:L-rhamnonate dehydratase
MKITEIRTRVVEWRGETAPPPPHFCTNALDILELPSGAMNCFRFLSWLVVEVMADTGDVGVGEAALAPRVAKQFIDLYLKPLVLGQHPLDCEFLW